MTAPAVDQRYPIGRFQFGNDVTPAERERDLRIVAAMPARMREAVSGLSDEQLDTPYRDGGWTVRQLVHHVPDSHLNAYTRFKLALTEDEPTIKPYDEAKWAELADSRLTRMEASLTMLDVLHERWDVLMRNMSDSDWDRALVHPEHGRRITLIEMLGLYAWHSKHHVAHIARLRERKGWS